MCFAARSLLTCIDRAHYRSARSHHTHTIAANANIDHREREQRGGQSLW